MQDSNHLPYSIALFGFMVITFSLLVSGCSQSGPDSIDQKSGVSAALPEKIEFLQRYVKFRRSYTVLDYHIQYQNNSGGLVPGPSDWDLKVIAKIPKRELSRWTTGLEVIDRPSNLKWLASVPTHLELSGVDRWYQSGHVVVGIDREQNIVVYRNWTE